MEYKILMALLLSYPKWAVLVESISFLLEIVAVLIIFISIIIAISSIIRCLFNRETAQQGIDTFKHTIGKGIQVALELLIAADIINTVVLDATLENVVVLAILVLIRTFLSWTLMFETEGRWPWGKGK